MASIYKPFAIKRDNIYTLPIAEAKCKTVCFYLVYELAFIEV